MRRGKRTFYHHMRKRSNVDRVKRRLLVQVKKERNPEQEFVPVRGPVPDVCEFVRSLG